MELKMINMFDIIVQNETKMEVINAWKNWGFDYRLGLTMKPFEEELAVFETFLWKLKFDNDNYYAEPLMHLPNIPEPQIIRVKEYNYDGSDRCSGCGYFERSFSKQVEGYCTKLGEERFEYDSSCQRGILL